MAKLLLQLGFGVLFLSAGFAFGQVDSSGSRRMFILKLNEAESMPVRPAGPANIVPASPAGDSLSSGPANSVPLTIQDDKYPDSSAVILYEREPSPTNLESVMQRLLHEEIAIAKETEIPPEKVILRILIDENGRYVRHYVIKSAHPVWIHPIQKAAKTIRWTPAILDGKAVPAWVTLPLTICLSK